jgi:hypothetical protein
LIVKEDPDAWNAALRIRLQDIFEQTKSSAGGVDATTNVGGNFYKKVWGDPHQRKIMKAAMTPSQYNYMEKLFTVLDRAGVILKRSGVTPKGELMEEIGGGALRKATRAITRPLYTRERLVGDWWLGVRMGKKSKELAEAMVSKKASKQLNRMYQLSPQSEKLIPMLSDFIAIMGGGALKRSHVGEMKQAH